MPSNKQSLEFEKPLLDLEKQLEDLLQASHDSDLDFSSEIKAIEKKIETRRFSMERSVKSSTGRLAAHTSLGDKALKSKFTFTIVPLSCHVEQTTMLQQSLRDKNMRPEETN